MYNHDTHFPFVLEQLKNISLNNISTKLSEFPSIPYIFSHVQCIQPTNYLMNMKHWFPTTIQLWAPSLKSPSPNISNQILTIIQPHTLNHHTNQTKVLLILMNRLMNA